MDEEKPSKKATAQSPTEEKLETFYVPALGKSIQAKDYNDAVNKAKEAKK